MDPTLSMQEGKLQVFVLSADQYKPIEGAKVKITDMGTKNTIPEQVTDSSGQTPIITLPAPDIEYTLEPDPPMQPYGEWQITVTAEGYETLTIDGSELLAEDTSLQTVRMHPLTEKSAPEEVIVIPSHTLYGDYPAKIPEEEIKPVTDTGEIVLSRVVIPEYVIVHDGAPSDKNAKNYWVRYKDYIKNVASSEIYSTWPENAIYANILVIQSFTLNRVYTEWYRNKGYNFTITSSTAYDQKWIYGRNIYERISRLVDNVFANYLSRPGVKQPIFTSYCDGRYVSCRGLSQWGSKNLAQDGYSTIDILRYYYGNDIYINSAQGISGVPSSWPGYELRTGSSGTKVVQLQNQLNRISRNFPAIPKLTADGIYGPKTAASVRSFQKVFGLPSTGVTDYATWYEISDIYVAVSRISEPGT